MNYILMKSKQSINCSKFKIDQMYPINEFFITDVIIIDYILNTLI
jgi:hypothetical protein